MSVASMVRAFHGAFGLVVRDTPLKSRLSSDERALRLRLLAEELSEVKTAIFREGTADVAAELADLVYVTYGTALHYGIDLDAAIAEVHAANMRKLWPDGKPRHREDGKVLKPEGWRKADVAGALGL